MKILPYYPANLSLCVEIYVRAFTTAPMDFHFITHEKARRYLRDTTKTPGFRGFTFSREGEIVAFLFGTTDDYFDGTIFTVREFAVLPEHWRGGVGTHAMQLLEDTLRREGMHSISLQTSRQLPAFHFYKKNGFTEETKSATLVKPL
jgi:GNAT superfamily N-acetyltransferase